MITDRILIFLPLTLRIIVSSSVIWLLLNRKIKFPHAIKLTCIATALNRLFLTGSGYVAMSGKLKINGLSLYKSLSSFAILELFSIIPWIILGLYFGTKIAIRIPLFLIALFVLVLTFAIYKRKDTINFLRNALAYLKEIRTNILMVTPLVLINVIIGIIYYFFLFRAFGFTFDFFEILRIISVAFTIGYLSPAPAGLGFKEGGLVFLLMQQNLSFSNACSIAIADRIITTGFYFVLGFLFGAEMIKNEIKRKLKVSRS